MKPRIAVLGGGPAGLAMAMRLLRRNDLGADVTVIERGPAPGGLARSFETDGLVFDCGSHRLHPSTAPEILDDLRVLLGSELLVRPRNGRIRLKGRFVKFPLQLGDLARRLPPSFLAGIGLDLATKPLRGGRSEPASFAEALRRSLGPTMCRDFYFPYARKLWGTEPDRISAQQAKRRVSANTIGKILVKVMGGGRNRGQGGKRVFFYPRGGFGQISTALAREVERLGGRIRLGSSVERVHVDDGSVEAVGVVPAAAANGASEETLPVDFVFSTIPLTILCSKLDPPPPRELADTASRLRFRSMVLCYLVLGADRFTPFDAHYFPEQDVVFSRISEPKIYRAATEPAGRTGLCAEIPCAVGDELWRQPDAAIVDRVKADLARCGLPVDAVLRRGFVVRLPYVYPVYDVGVEERFASVDRYLGGLGKLVSLGRQGLFAHDNTHHTIEMSYRASECLRPDLSFDHETWAAHRARFQSNVVED
ncbi:MAG TPA: FAD-dependent oxidoreductase [Planctomycetota bacterium]|nr:FAD-dependent oxidoreductase [Planctomycetota bacterium]